MVRRGGPYDLSETGHPWDCPPGRLRPWQAHRAVCRSSSPRGMQRGCLIALGKARARSIHAILSGKRIGRACPMPRPPACWVPRRPCARRIHGLDPSRIFSGSLTIPRMSRSIAIPAFVIHENTGKGSCRPVCAAAIIDAADPRQTICQRMTRFTPCHPAIIAARRFRPGVCTATAFMPINHVVAVSEGSVRLPKPRGGGAPAYELLGPGRQPKPSVPAGIA